jgi:hypothetical protein
MIHTFPLSVSPSAVASSGFSGCTIEDENVRDIIASRLFFSIFYKSVPKIPEVKKIRISKQKQKQNTHTQKS